MNLNLKNFLNKTIYFVLKINYTIKGYIISKKLKEGKVYYNNYKQAYAIYKGNRTFFETKQIIESTYGVEFFDSRKQTYTYLQIGLFFKPEIIENVMMENFI